MKCQDLFSLKNKKKNIFEGRLLQSLLGAIRVKNIFKLLLFNQNDAQCK